LDKTGLLQIAQVGVDYKVFFKYVAASFPRRLLTGSNGKQALLHASCWNGFFPTHRHA
jgi:hypothetical protein